MASSSGGWDCLRAGDACSGDDTCSPRLRTLRQCVAGDGSVKLGPGARNQCENAMTALLSTPLHGCQCKRGMKKEKNCLSIYWSLHQSVLHGEAAAHRGRRPLRPPPGEAAARPPGAPPSCRVSTLAKERNVVRFEWLSVEKVEPRICSGVEGGGRLEPSPSGLRSAPPITN